MPPWVTIDFLEFYAREALRLARARTPIQLPGEHDELRYIPLGVGAVIPPWNFPFAIMAGMTSAAIVCGNTVVLKPSSESPTIAARFVEVLEEAGMPPGVVNFCPPREPHLGARSSAIRRRALSPSQARGTWVWRFTP
jgi:1-pyrroline-5-carboxylate dehydrogenase